MIGLPIHDQRQRTLKCGCVRSATDYGNGFTVREFATSEGCQSHEPGARKPRDGMSNSKRFAVLQRDNFTCQYCGRGAPAVKLEVDHVTAVANGGSSEMTNLITSCKECNRGKRDT